MNVAPIRRRMKNVVRNYSEAQRKVREATSNDPWGPSSSLMSEIADLTYNVVAFSEIMQMIWKRLNDHGKNWRHVYKALVLLEYIIKTGTEKVAQQCKENIFAIQTLKDFQYIEENKDQGMNVREKAKQLVALLKDDERLKNERARALKAKERFAQTATGIGSNSSQYGGVSGGSPQPEYQSGYSDSNVKEDQEGAVEAELECARPQTAGEEELQLQLALAMSKEEAEQEERIRRGDDVRLQLALTESQEDFRKQQEHLQHNPGGAGLLDILDGSAAVSYNAAAPLTDPWGVPLTSNQPSHPEGWGSPSTARSTPALTTDPWGTRISRSNTPSSAGTTPTRAVAASSRPATQSVSQTDPWGASIAKSAAPAVDPWGAPLRTSPPPNTQQNASGFDTFSTQSNGDLDDFDLISSRNTASSTNNGFDLLEGSSASQSPFDFGNMTQTLSNNQQHQASKRKTPETFLGENSSLVNLDALVTKSTSQASTGSTNPFAAVGASNPFQNSRQSVPMNRMRSPTLGYQISSDVLPTPLLPTASSIRSQTPSNNPFL